jgi:2-polyprenyl-3-methyl-5-hydroxy-6-metoxy-1,4-benzoquinol methylase
MTSAQHNQAVAFHDELAERWEQKYARRTFSKRADAILSLPGGDAHTGEHWLDAGCGSGTIARRLAQQGCRVTAVDGAARMIEVAERAAATDPGAARLRFLKIEDIAALPFGEATFDAVVCSSVLEYVAAPAQVLMELARVLRPAGRLLVSIPNRRALLRLLQKITYSSMARCGLKPWPGYLGLSRHDYTRQQFARLLAAGAFEPRAWRYYGPALPEALSDTRYAGTLLMVLCVKCEPPTRAT